MNRAIGARVEILDPIRTAGLVLEDRSHLEDQVRKTLLEALRPSDGGLAGRTNLGSFKGHAFGVKIK